MLCNKFKAELKNAYQKIEEYKHLQTAIDKVMAIIEFTSNGEIITANENFLTTVGYQLSEIQGKHHKIFMNPMDVGLNSYKDFWARLAAGEYISERFKRVNKKVRRFGLKRVITLF